MRIDAHQHFWDLSRLEYGWMPAGEGVLRRNYLPEDLGTILEDNRFDGSVAVQAHTSMEETRWLLELAGAHAFVLGVVAWVDLAGPRVGDVLDELQKHPKFKGVRHPVHDEADVEWLLRTDVANGLRELARRGIPYDLLLRPAHLPLVRRVAELAPGLRMAIDHIAKPPIASGVLDGWAEDLAEAAQVPGLCCKLSGMITEADHARWSAADLRPYVRHALSVFGAERSMFGSDWPVCKLAGSWKRALAAFTQAIGAQTMETREHLLGGTAIRFYGLRATADPGGSVFREP